MALPPFPERTCENTLESAVARIENMSVSLRDVRLLSLQSRPTRALPQLPSASRSSMPVPPDSHPRPHLSSLSKLKPIAKHDTGRPLGSQGVAPEEGGLGGKKKNGTPTLPLRTA